MQTINYPRQSLLIYFLVFQLRNDTNLISFNNSNTKEEIFSHPYIHTINSSCNPEKSNILVTFLQTLNYQGKDVLVTFMCSNSDMIPKLFQRDSVE